MGISEPIKTNYEKLTDIVNLGEVDAYVHIGEGTDDLLRYLTRIDGEDNYYTFIHTSKTTVACIPPRYMNEATDAFPGDELREMKPEHSAVDSVQEFLDDDPLIRVPETIPAGIVHELESFATVEIIDEPDTVWCVKNNAEVEILADIAEGVQYGMARAETILASANVRGDQLVWKEEELTTGRLRQEVQKSLADCGLSDFGNIIVGAGPSCANLHFTGYDTIKPCETVLIDLGPRGPLGYYGDISRTFVPGIPSDWAMEAYEIVEEALEAAFDSLKQGAGLTTRELYDSIISPIESSGYETNLHETSNDAVGLYHGTGHGIGVRMHEKPFQSSDSETTLETGNVLTIEPGLYDPSRGGVRLEDVVLIKENGFEDLIDYPRQIKPVERRPCPS